MRQKDRPHHPPARPRGEFAAARDGRPGTTFGPPLAVILPLFPLAAMQLEASRLWPLLAGLVVAFWIGGGIIYWFFVKKRRQPRAQPASKEQTAAADSILRTVLEDYFMGDATQQNDTKNVLLGHGEPAVIRVIGIMRRALAKEKDIFPNRSLQTGPSFGPVLDSSGPPGSWPSLWWRGMEVLEQSRDPRAGQLIYDAVMNVDRNAFILFSGRGFILVQGVAQSIDDPAALDHLGRSLSAAFGRMTRDDLRILYGQTMTCIRERIRAIHQGGAEPAAELLAEPLPYPPAPTTQFAPAVPAAAPALPMPLVPSAAAAPATPPTAGFAPVAARFAAPLAPPTMVPAAAEAPVSEPGPADDGFRRLGVGDDVLARMYGAIVTLAQDSMFEFGLSSEQARQLRVAVHKLASYAGAYQHPHACDLEYRVRLADDSNSLAVEIRVPVLNWDAMCLAEEDRGHMFLAGKRPASAAGILSGTKLMSGGVFLVQMFNCLEEIQKLDQRAKIDRPTTAAGDGPSPGGVPPWQLNQSVPQDISQFGIERPVRMSCGFCWDRIPGEPAHDIFSLRIFLDDKQESLPFDLQFHDGPAETAQPAAAPADPGAAPHKRSTVRLPTKLSPVAAEAPESRRTRLLIAGRNRLGSAGGRARTRSGHLG